MPKHTSKPEPQCAPELAHTPESEPMPAPEQMPHSIRRRRSEQEIFYAMIRVDAARDALHVHSDDEHADVLRDIAVELMELRLINATLLQDVSNAHQSAQAAIKNMIM